MTHTRKRHRGGNEVPEYIVRKSLARIAENIAKNTARLEKLEKETKKKFRPVARHAAAVAREKSGHAAPYYTKKHGGRPAPAAALRTVERAAAAPQARARAKLEATRAETKKVVDKAEKSVKDMEARWADFEARFPRR